jgi:phage-related protein
MRERSKEVRWVGASRDRLKEFPGEAMDEAGHMLRQVQRGIEPADWKPMRSIGAGVLELRIHNPQEFRVIYIAKYPEAIYVLHAFSKKTPKTAVKDIEIARAAYAEVRKNRCREWT